MAVLAAILGVAIWLVAPALPRTLRVSYRLPDELRSLSIDYERDGEVARSVTFRWSDPSPERLRHEPELAAGRYVIVVTLRDARGATHHQRRSVDLDPERVTHVDLR